MLFKLRQALSGKVCSSSAAATGPDTIIAAWKPLAGSAHKGTLGDIRRLFWALKPITLTVAASLSPG